MIGCQTLRTPGEYFQRGNFKTCITAFEKGYMFCDGVKKEIPSRLTIPETNDDYLDASDYYEDKEYRLYKCLKFKQCN